MSTGWTSFGGAWKSEGDLIENDSEDRGPKLMNGSLRWKNYFVEANVQLLGPYGDAGLIIRSYGEEEGVDSFHGYYAGIRDMDNSLILGRADFGWSQYVVRPIFPEVTGWHHIKLLAYDCSIAVSVTNSSGLGERAYVNDPQCIAKGRFGLKSYGASAEWKNIRIGPANRRDLEEMTRGIAPVVAGYNLQALDRGLSTKALDRYTDPMRREAGKHHFNLNTRAIGSLALTAVPDPVPVTIHGVVTLVSPVLYVQDSSAGIPVQPLDPAIPVKAGDEVEAQGYLSGPSLFPVLSRASIQLLWPNTPISPVAVSPFELASGNNIGKLVEVEGELVSQTSAPGKPSVLTLKNESQEFYAIENRVGGPSGLRHLKPGSRLRLHGVATTDASLTHNLAPFALLLSAADDIEVIALPPWWSPAHIVWTLVALLLLAVAAHLLLSRIQLWRHQAVLDERERLALDMHDSLAQSFAGIAFQLQVVCDEVREREPLRGQVQAALEMVRRSHAETKRSMATMRPSFAGDGDIADSLKQVAERLSDGGRLVVSSSTHGQARDLPQDVADTFFLVGQEAISNSVRHAGASHLDISLDAGRDQARLSVRDDGCGFAVETQRYGFGLRGMEKRAAKVRGHLELSSSPGMGTTVTVRAHFVSRHPITQNLRSLLGCLTKARF